jgi:hypothetical protein
MSDALTLAHVEIVGDQGPSRQTIRLRGFADKQTMELPAGGTVELSSGEHPTTRPPIFKPGPLGTPVRAGLIGSFEHGLTDPELARVPAGGPLVIAVYGATLDLGDLKMVAAQATAADHSLVVLARLSEGE